MTYYHTPWSVFFSALIREASPCSILTKRSTTGKSTENERVRIISPECDIAILPLPSRFRDLSGIGIRKPEVKVDFKIFPDTIGRRTYELIAVWTTAVCTGLTQAQFRQNLSKEEGKLAQNRTQSQEAFPNDSCREMKNQFSPVKWQWIYQPYPKAGPMYRGGLSTQTGLPVFQRLFFFSFLFFHFVP